MGLFSLKTNGLMCLCSWANLGSLYQGFSRGTLDSTPPSTGFICIGAFTVLPLMLGLHKPPKGSTLGELCSGWVHRCFPDYLQVSSRCSSQQSHDRSCAYCDSWCDGTGDPLGALPSPSFQTSECIVSGVGWDLGIGMDRRQVNQVLPSLQ